MGSRTSGRSTTFLLVCAIVGVIALAAMRPKPDRTRRTEPAPTPALPAPANLPTSRSPTIRPTDPILGDPNAPLTIVEFGDFTCPACAEAGATLMELRRIYGDRLQIIWKDLPILNRATGSRRTHVAARCAQAQGKFWEYHERAFDEFPQHDSDRERIAIALGLDLEELRSCVNDPTALALVETNAAEATTLSITGTPTFFVNGELMIAPPTLENFRSLLDRRR